MAPGQRVALQNRLKGLWLTIDQATADPPAIPSELSLSPTAPPVFTALKKRHDHFQQNPPKPEAKRNALQAEARRQLFSPVPDHPSVDALAKEWLSHNLHGVRHLTRAKLDEILDAGNRAFNLRVADPYLRYQMQGQGFTWSFFTHKPVATSFPTRTSSSPALTITTSCCPGTLSTIIYTSGSCSRSAARRASNIRPNPAT